MERGEVDGLCGWGWSIFKSERTNWKTADQFNFLVQMSITPEPELTALGVPDFGTFVSGDKKKAAELIISQQAFSRPYIAPPETPADRVDDPAQGVLGGARRPAAGRRVRQDQHRQQADSRRRAAETDRAGLLDVA